MNKKDIAEILTSVKNGKKSVREALKDLKNFPYNDIGFAKIDTHRDLRKGVPEVIFCEGKTVEQVVRIFKSLRPGTFTIATRADIGLYEEVSKVKKDVKYFEKARILFSGKKRKKTGKMILVVTAGTSDIPVAEEAAVTAELTGNKVERLYDIGVSGIHRMLSKREILYKANVLVVAAGMDGVLPSIIGGIVERPVIAVPTDVGYGANFNGLAPLLTMLNSCAPGVAVVNINNGFGAGYLANMINKTGGRA